MVTSLLVGNEISEGRRLPTGLDAARFPVDAAFWFFEPEESRWKYYVASPVYDSGGPLEAYGRIDDVLRNDHIPISLSDIRAVGAKNQIARVVRSAWNSLTHEVDEGRLSGVGDSRTFIEDAYIYRAS